MTARDFKLDPVTGDWDVSTGDLLMLADADAIIQSARIHMQFFQGEWFLDLGAGVPYWQSILGRVSDPDVLQPIFRKALLEPLGVKSIQSLDLTINHATRTLNVTFQLLTDVGLLAPVSGTVG